VRRYEGTGGDRTSLELPGDQAALIQAVLDVGKPTAIVVLSGGCVALEQFAENQANMPAIMTAGYPGFMGGTAIAKTVMGDYNPGGKLAQTWYKAGMVNELDMTSMDMSAAPGRGYRYYQNKPVWAFGHGLSYTTFDLDVQEPKGSVTQKGDKATFSVDVKNTGAVDGDEVVQLYVRARKRAAPKDHQGHQGCGISRLHVGLEGAVCGRSGQARGLEGAGAKLAQRRSALLRRKRAAERAQRGQILLR
jgi:beta-glucosidase